VADALPLAVLALVLIGAATVTVTGTCLLIAVGRWLGGRLARRPTSIPPPVPAQASLGRVWLACDTPRCGHLQTQHIPVLDDQLMCDGCGLIRPRP
jgi:hypothetical protein